MENLQEVLVHGVGIIGSSIPGDASQPAVGRRCEPKVLDFFPPKGLSESSKRALALFCFPQEEIVRGSRAPKTFIPFMFTNDLGQKFYVSCFAFDEKVTPQHFTSLPSSSPPSVVFPSPPPSLLGGRGTGGGAGGGREGGEDVRGELKRASKKLHGFKFFNEENSQETDTNAFLEKKKLWKHKSSSHFGKFNSNDPEDPRATLSPPSPSLRPPSSPPLSPSTTYSSTTSAPLFPLPTSPSLSPSSSPSPPHSPSSSPVLSSPTITFTPSHSSSTPSPSPSPSLSPSPSPLPTTTITFTPPRPSPSPPSSPSSVRPAKSSPQTFASNINIFFENLRPNKGKSNTKKGGRGRLGASNSSPSTTSSPSPSPSSSSSPFVLFVSKCSSPSTPSSASNPPSSCASSSSPIPSPPSPPPSPSSRSPSPPPSSPTPPPTPTSSPPPTPSSISPQKKGENEGGKGAGGRREFVRKVICITSTQPYFQFFKDYLTNMYTTLTHTDSVTIEQYIANLLYDLPIPPPGSEIELGVRVSPTTTLFYKTPSPRDFPLLDLSLQYLFLALDVENVMTFFRAVLTEKRIVLCSRCFSLITYATETLFSLIYPFQWSHTYIPVLPEEGLLDYITLTTPFIIGVQPHQLKKFPDHLLEELVIIDLDHNLTYFSHLPPLPFQEENKLTSNIRSVLHPEIFQLDKVTIPDDFGRKSDSLSSGGCERKIRSAFLEFFVTLFGGFRDFLQTTKFNKDAFLSQKSDDSRAFLQEFIDTNAFSTLVINSTTKNTLPHLFECLISQKMTIDDLINDPCPSKILPILPSPIKETFDFGKRRAFPTTVSHSVLEDFALQKTSCTELLDIIKLHLREYRYIPQLHLFKALLLLQRKEIFQAMQDFATFFSLDGGEEYPQADRIFFEPLMHEMSDEQLHSLSELKKGPISEIARFVIEERESSSFSSESSEDVFGFEVIQRGSPIELLPYEGLQQMEFSPKTYTVQSSFVKIMIQKDICRSREKAELLFDILHKKSNNQAKTKGIKNSVIANFVHHLIQISKGESYPKKIPLREDEFVVISFSRVYDQKGNGGDLYLTNKGIMFKNNKWACEWKQVEGVEEQDTNVVLGGVPWLKVMLVDEEGKQSASRFGFWSKDQRDICKMMTTELCVGFGISCQLHNDAYFLLAQRDVTLVEAIRRSLRSGGEAKFLRNFFSFVHYPDYQWFTIASQLSKNALLNLQPELPNFEGKARGSTPLQLSSKLLDDILQPFFSNMQDDGFSVNFQAIKNSSALVEFCVAASELHKVKLDKLNQGERLAFFVNIYNTLLIHAYTEVGSFPTSSLDFDYICRFARYSISGMLFSLNDILHGILRGNKNPFEKNAPYFSANDIRANFTIKDPTPAILFLLANHLPKSPFVRNIDSCERLGLGLKVAAMAYVQEYVLISPPKPPHPRHELPLPPLFSFPEFGETDNQIITEWILPYIDRTSISAKTLSVLESCDVSVSFETQEYAPFARPLISLSAGMSTVLPPNMMSEVQKEMTAFPFKFLRSSSSPFQISPRRRSLNLSPSPSTSPCPSSPTPPLSPPPSPSPSPTHSPPPHTRHHGSFSHPAGKSPKHKRERNLSGLAGSPVGGGGVKESFLMLVGRGGEEERGSGKLRWSGKSWDDEIEGDD